MAVRIADTLSPMGDFSVVNASNVACADGETLQEKLDNGRLGFSGDYNDLTNKPEIPSSLDALESDENHRTVTDEEKEGWDAKSDFSGDYNDLENVPTIPSALRDLADDATHRTVTDEEKTSWDAKSDFSGDYNDLENAPSIPNTLADLTSDATHRTVSDEEKTAWNGKLDASQKGVINGVATLDGQGRIPYSQLPETAMEYKGTWNALTNTPTLTDGVGTHGDVYIVAVAGNGYAVNDRVIYDGAAAKWIRLPAGSVESVNGQSGSVVLTKSDINLGNVDNTSDMDKPISTAVQNALDALDIPEALSDLSGDSTHRTVTDAEKASWDAKSEFSGDYNDLTNKPEIPETIPTKLSDLASDETHRTVTDVEKSSWSDKYTKDEADNKFIAKKPSWAQQSQGSILVLSQDGDIATSDKTPSDLAVNETYREVDGDPTAPVYLRNNEYVIIRNNEQSISILSPQPNAEQTGCHGWIYFSNKSGQNTVTLYGFTAVLGDDITTATTSGNWEFNVLNGRIILVNWG